MEKIGNYTQNFRKLLAKRLDAIVVPKYVAAYILKKKLSEEERSAITYSPTLTGKAKYYIVFSKRIVTVQNTLNSLIKA